MEMDLDPDGAEIVRIGAPVYRNPIQLGSMRPTVKQRLGPRNYPAFVRIGPPVDQHGPQNYGSPAPQQHGWEYAPISSSGYTAGYSGGPPRVSRHFHQSSPSPDRRHRSLSNGHDRKNRRKSTPEKSRSKRRERSSSSHKSKPRPSPSKDKQNSSTTKMAGRERDISNIVIKRNLLKGKRTVQYNSTSMPKSPKAKTKTNTPSSGKETTPSSSASTSAESKTEESKPKAKPKNSTESEIESSGVNKAGDNGNGNNPILIDSDGEELVVIESISGCSSADEGEIEDDDVEVLQLRREALEAMVKKLDQSPPRDSAVEKEKNSENNTKTNTTELPEITITAITSDDVSEKLPPASVPPVNPEEPNINMEIDEKSLREKLLIDISQKRNLNVNGNVRDSTPTPTLPLPTTTTPTRTSSNTLAVATTTTSGRAMPKHSPIRFPSAATPPTIKSPSRFENVAFTSKFKHNDLRYTLQNRIHVSPQWEPQIVPFASMQNRNHSPAPGRPVRIVTDPTKLTKYKKSHNRVFNRIHDFDMGNITITIPNPAKKVIIPLDVPTTDEESQSSPEVLHTDVNPLVPQDYRKMSSKDTPASSALHDSTQETSNTNHQLPESFQLKLAQLLKDAKDDFHRSVQMDPDVNQKRRKEMEIHDLQTRAKRLEEEEEAIRKEKIHLAYLKAERKRRLSTKVKPSTSTSTSPKATSTDPAKSIKSSSSMPNSTNPLKIIDSFTPGKSPELANSTKALVERRSKTATPTPPPSNFNSPRASASPPKKIQHRLVSAQNSPTKSASPNPPLNLEAKSSFQALKHLPIHKQVEYMKLQSQILEHEHKLAEARFSLGLEGPGEFSKKSESRTPSVLQGLASFEQLSMASPLPSTSSSLTADRDTTLAEIEALFQREKMLKAALMETMQISQNHLTLKGKENELINARKCCYDAMSALNSAMIQENKSTGVCHQLEEKIEQLQHQLKVATDSLREEQCRLDASKLAIEHATKESNEMEQQCGTLETICVDLGKKTKGLGYKLPKLHSEELKKKKEEVEKTSKMPPSSPQKMSSSTNAVAGAHKTLAQRLRLKSLARAIKTKQHYNWKNVSPCKKKRDSQSQIHAGEMYSNNKMTEDDEDKEEMLMLPRITFQDMLTSLSPAIREKSRVWMSKYKEYASPLRHVYGEDGGFLQEQLTGMAIQKIHPAITMCSFEVRTRMCHSEACSLQHLYRPNQFS